MGIFNNSFVFYYIGYKMLPHQHQTRLLPSMSHPPHPRMSMQMPRDHPTDYPPNRHLMLVPMQKMVVMMMNQMKQIEVAQSLGGLGAGIDREVVGGKGCGRGRGSKTK